MHCRHHPVCPGCPLLDLPYEAQLARKRARVATALARYPHLGLGEVPAVRPALHDTAYRHRLKLPVDVRGPHVAVGLYHPTTRAVLNTPDCPVLVEPLRQALGVVQSWLAHRTGVHAIDLRVSDATGELQLVIACDGASLHGGKAAIAALRNQLPKLTSVALSQAEPERKRVMGRSPEVVSGELWIDEAIGVTRYHLHPGAFFQADPRNAVGLHELVRGYVGDAQTVLDLYSGVGAYALALAPGRKRVVAVEEVPQAARAARDLAPDNVEVLSSRVEDLAITEAFDVAILNPARRGSDPRTLARIAALAQRVVYVSCGPEALARDLDALAALGLRVDALAPLDLFPQTPEVETVVHLTRGAPIKSWDVTGGRAGGPWLGHISGAIGRPREVIALVLHDPGPRGEVPGGRWERIGIVASHALVRIWLQGPLDAALDAFSRHGHAIAGDEPRTKRFFAEKAGLLRPFVHVLRGGRATTAPLHGDLDQALVWLGASDAVRSAAGAAGVPAR